MKDNLPARYTSEGIHRLGYRPIDDWVYLKFAHSSGARFAGHGVQVNATQAKKRLEADGLWEICNRQKLSNQSLNHDAHGGGIEKALEQSEGLE